MCKEVVYLNNETYTRIRARNDESWWVFYDELKWRGVDVISVPCKVDCGTKCHVYYNVHQYNKKFNTKDQRLIQDMLVDLVGKIFYNLFGGQR